MAPSSTAGGDAEPSAPETVLVVEGEVLIRMVIAEYLRDCGFRVLEARNAEEATKILRTDERVDFVFINAVMPGSVDGFSLAQWVRRERAPAKVVLSSGVRRQSAAAGELCDQGPLMAKPYGAQEVERRIRKLMAQAK